MRDYAKLVDQVTQTVSLAAGSSVTLSSPWVVQPQQGSGDLRVAGDLGAVGAVAPRVIFRVVDLATVPDLTGLTATLLWQEQSVTGQADSAPISEDITGDLLLSRGRVQVDLGDLNIEQVSLTLTQQVAVEQKTYLCRVELWGLYAPHRAPAQPQDTQGFGYGGVYTVNGVPQTLADRNLRKDQVSHLGGLLDPRDEPAPWEQE